MSDQKMKMWYCKVGEIDPAKLPASGADEAMREAVERRYHELTGEAWSFIFSGWGAELEERERAVVEDREPDYFKTEWLEHRLHEVRAHFRGDDPLPEDWSAEQWIATVMVKLGEAAYHLHADLHKSGRNARDMRLGIECLMATAATALDAVEALEGVKPDAET